MSDDTRQRVLLVANRTCPCPDVLASVRELAEGGEVLVVAPALNTRLRHMVSDVDGAAEAARERLGRALAWLADKGIVARGEVGDSDPLVAIDDALAVFDASQVVISTYPPGHSNWLERRLVDRARERVDVPVVHLVSRYGLAETA